MATNLNRVVEFYQNWEREAEGLKKLAIAGGEEKELLKAKYDFLSKGVYRVGINPSLGEQLGIRVINGVLKNLEKEIYPNRFLRAVHQLKVALIDRPNYIDRFIKERQENLKQLDVVLRSKGLDQYFGKLEQYLDYERRAVHIDLPASLNQNTDVDFRLRIEKESGGLYQLEAVQVNTRFADQPEKNRYFDFNAADYSLNADKTANLMMGRAVINGNSNQWLQLENAADPDNHKVKVYQADRGFDLEGTLRELAGQIGTYRITAADFIHELKQGHQMKLNGRHPSDEPVFIEASPGANGVIIRDQRQNVIGVDDMFMGTRLAHEKERTNQLALVQDKNQKNNVQDQSYGIGS